MVDTELLGAYDLTLYASLPKLNVKDVTSAVLYALGTPDYVQVYSVYFFGNMSPLLAVNMITHTADSHTCTYTQIKTLARISGIYKSNKFLFSQIEEIILQAMFCHNSKATEE